MYRYYLATMAIPSRASFDQLPLQAQLGLVVFEGTFLATRFEEEDTVNLYHMGSFFAEVYYDPEVNHLHHCRTFVRKEELEDYAVYIDLPEL